MSAPLILLAHAADSSALASAVSRRLAGLGYGVTQFLIGAGVKPALSVELAQAQRLIVLWSRGAAGANLEAPLRHAEEAGKLSVIQLASAPTPTRFKQAARKLPRPGDSDAAWRGLAENVAPLAPRAQASERAYRREPGSRLHGLLVLVLMGLVLTWAAYVANPDLAAQLNALL
jgi:hypothetical protein